MLNVVWKHCLNKIILHWLTFKMIDLNEELFDQIISKVLYSGTNCAMTWNLSQRSPYSKGSWYVIMCVCVCVCVCLCVSVSVLYVFELAVWFVDVFWMVSGGFNVKPTEFPCNEMCYINKIALHYASCQYSTVFNTWIHISVGLKKSRSNTLP